MVYNFLLSLSFEYNVILRTWSLIFANNKNITGSLEDATIFSPIQLNWTWFSMTTSEYWFFFVYTYRVIAVCRFSSCHNNTHHQSASKSIYRSIRMSFSGTLLQLVGFGLGVSSFFTWHTFSYVPYYYCRIVIVGPWPVAT